MTHDSQACSAKEKQSCDRDALTTTHFHCSVHQARTNDAAVQLTSIAFTMSPTYTSNGAEYNTDSKASDSGIHSLFCLFKMFDDIYLTGKSMTKLTCILLTKSSQSEKAEFYMIHIGHSRKDDTIELVKRSTVATGE